MVKNLSGGNKSKGFARKNIAKKDNKLRVSEEEGEIYAQVTKTYGGALCQVITLDGTEMLCHIRGKFRGRGKRDNFISVGSWLLVGKREWENDLKNKRLNCDIIEVYNDSDKIKLQNILNINWSVFVTNDTKSMFTSETNDYDNTFTFTDEKTQEYQDLLETQLAEQHKNSKHIIQNDNNEIINVDDI